MQVQKGRSLLLSQVSPNNSWTLPELNLQGRIACTFSCSFVHCCKFCHAWLSNFMVLNEFIWIDLRSENSQHGGHVNTGIRGLSLWIWIFVLNAKLWDSCWMYLTIKCMWVLWQLWGLKKMHIFCCGRLVKKQHFSVFDFTYSNNSTTESDTVVVLRLS